MMSVSDVPALSCSVIFFSSSLFGVSFETATFERLEADVLVADSSSAWVDEVDGKSALASDCLKKPPLEGALDGEF